MHRPHSRPQTFIGRWSVALALALALAFCCSSGYASCQRTYVVGVAESGRYVYLENLQIKGTLPTLLNDVSRRTGCRFKIEILPRARFWIEWDAQTVDIVGVVVPTPERDKSGAFVMLGPLRLTLNTFGTAAAPPNQSLENWLDLPSRPTLGYLRSSVYGAPVQRLIDSPSHQGQVDASADNNTLVRKLFARHLTGILMNRETFKETAEALGFDASIMSRHHVQELPDVPIGLYLNLANISAQDRQTLIPEIATLSHLVHPDLDFQALQASASVASQPARK
jgi:polar amino acid transport system substrate-binding protein